MNTQAIASGWIRVVAARSSRDAWNGQVGQVVGVSEGGATLLVCFGRASVRFFSDEIEQIAPPKEG